MKEHIVLTNEFIWGKESARKPILRVANRGYDLFLVNMTGETLSSVKASTGGFTGEASVSSETYYQYKDVEPNQAVKIEEYDFMYDSDFVLQVYVEVESPKLGTLQISTPPEKGGFKDRVLIWDDGKAETQFSVHRV